MLLARYVSEELHAEISLAGTCEGALRLANEKTFDVILLDLLMPGIGGFEVLKQIREDSANQSTPVVIVSILATSIEGEGLMAFERAMSMGAQTFVSKPVTRTALIAAVKAQLGVKV